MASPTIHVCPGTLANGHSSYSRTCLIRVFYGKKVSHILPYKLPGKSEEDAEKFMENRKRISISGVQEKLSLILEKNVLRLTREGEQGMYILKPIPGDVKKTDQVSANEHLTMQIARQVYKINTAENALIFFKGGEPAYITKRFDIKEDGSKYGQEDFASLAGKSKDTAGNNFKYTGSYEDIARLMKKYVSAYRVEVEKFFTIVLFNYLFSNGDAHLKNFTLIESPTGDYILSPAYDLICTSLHVNENSALALDDGLFSDNYYTKSYEVNGFYAYDDFYEFALRIGLMKNRAEKILEMFKTEHSLTGTLIENSFLSQNAKKEYLRLYYDRLKALNYSYRK